MRFQEGWRKCGTQPRKNLEILCPNICILHAFGRLFTALVAPRVIHTCHKVGDYPQSKKWEIDPLFPPASTPMTVMSVFERALSRPNRMQCSRKRVQQLKKRKKSCFLDFQKNVKNVKNVIFHGCLMFIVPLHCRQNLILLNVHTRCSAMAQNGSHS